MEPIKYNLKIEIIPTDPKVSPWYTTYRDISLSDAQQTLSRAIGRWPMKVTLTPRI